MASINFNAESIELTTRGPVDPGVYEAVLVESEMKPTRSGGGIGINLKFEIISEGPAKGRWVWTWLNYKHPNVEAQRIAQEELARLCKAVGVADLKDTEQLHNIPLFITVGIDRADPARNLVKGYRAKSAPSAQPVQSGDPGSAPWRR